MKSNRRRYKPYPKPAKAGGGAGPLVEVQDNNVLSEMKYAQGRTRLVSKTKHE